MTQPLKRQSYRQLLLLLCLVSVLATGCSAPVLFEPNAGVIDALGLSQAQQRMKEILLRAVAPHMDEVEVTEEFVRYHLARTVYEVRVPFRDVYNTEVFSNNLVLMRGRDGQVLARAQLATPEDAITFADLLLGFARRMRGSSARFAPPQPTVLPQAEHQAVAPRPVVLRPTSMTKTISTSP